MVKVAVSLSSSIKSLATVRVTCPLVLPSAIVICAGIVPLKSALSAVPVKARFRVWLLTTGYAAIAVRVMAVVPASVPVVVLIVRLTVGAGMVMVKVVAADVSLPLLAIPPLSFSCTEILAVPGSPVGCS
nr:hypothetical protein [[Phormidium] sp. ETS-05]